MVTIGLSAYLILGLFAKIMFRCRTTIIRSIDLHTELVTFKLLPIKACMKEIFNGYNYILPCITHDS